MINTIIKIYSTNTDYTFRVKTNNACFDGKLQAWFSSGIILKTNMFGKIGIHDIDITKVTNDYMNKVITLEIEIFDQRN